MRATRELFSTRIRKGAILTRWCPPLCFVNVVLVEDLASTASAAVKLFIFNICLWTLAGGSACTLLLIVRRLVACTPRTMSSNLDSNMSSRSVTEAGRWSVCELSLGVLSETRVDTASKKPAGAARWSA